MNGAQALIQTLVAAGVDVCFANPGTSEMHFVAALDTVPEMRGVLALFEGVATGAADGYARMTGRPAATLLHLGPGLGNGLANLHNARRAATPVVSIVGDHALAHKPLDAPLETDIESIARGVSSWIRTSRRAADVAGDGADAVAAALEPPGQVATLILPADVSWSKASGPSAPRVLRQPAAVSDERVEAVAKVLRSGEPAALLVGGRVVASRDGLAAAASVAGVAGAKLLSETFPSRMRRGAGVPAVERLGYLAEFAAMQLDGLRHLVIVDTVPPVSFFAYPDKASVLVPDGCEVHTLATGHEDAIGALSHLADRLGARADEPTAGSPERPPAPTGSLSAETLAAAIGATLPDEAIIADEGNTSGLFLAGATAAGPPHDLLCLTGGAIGFGMPVATGAAIAAPDRKVLNLQADGSAMYTFQALWTQAREQLDVVTVICNNRSYAILNMELGRVGAESGPRARRMLDLFPPDLDFVSLAQGMGITSSRATTAEELTAQLRTAMDEPGPHLIDAIVPSAF